MRDNGPVTGREVELQPNQYLVSRTDVRGVIEFANQAFVDISGYRKEELLGQPHNLVRHPDMPPAAFADLWDTLKQGRSWVGLVKNRAKNGDHYWVRAAVSPVLVDGRLTGYISVRVKPTRAEIEGAEAAYARIRAGDTGLRVVRGRAVVTGFSGWWRRTTATIRFRLAAGIILALVLVGVSSAIGLIGMRDSNARIDTLYADRLVPAVQLSTIARCDRDNRAILESVADGKSAPDAPKRVMTNATEAARQLEAYLQTYLTPEETVLAKRLQDVRSDWQSTVVDAGLKFAQAGDIAQLKPLIAGARPKLDAVVAVIDDLVQLQMDVGKALIDEQQGDYAMHFLWSLVLAIAAVVIASISVLLIIRRLGQSMQVLGHGMDEVAGGRFDSQVDLDRQDEFAPLMLALATLQTKLGYISISEHEARAALMREFDISVGQVLRQLAGSIDTLRGTAQSQSSVAGQVSGNADTVAASSSELNASIKEIASQATQVSDLARATAAQAAQSRETMNRLAKAAQEITAVAKLIAEIAEQTNLLALNATIEAARAGDVGRGFAVVAGEVKSLANQTQNATGDIGRKITAVQSDSAAAVKALEEVAASIDKLSGAAQSIAAAVEEQAAVVDEVARNAEQTSAAAKETGAAAKAVSDTSETMAQGNLALADAVEKFKKTSG